MKTNTAVPFLYPNPNETELQGGTRKQKEDRNGDQCGPDHTPATIPTAPGHVEVLVGGHVWQVLLVGYPVDRYYVWVLQGGGSYLG